MTKSKFSSSGVSEHPPYKIIHIITSLDTGGAELMLFRLVERLQQHFDQHVISLTDAGVVAEKLSAIGVPITVMGVSSSWPNPLKIVQLAWKIWCLRPNVVQTWLYHADFMGGIASRLAGVRALVWNIRNNDLSADKSKARTRGIVYLNSKLSRWLPASIVCCSQNAMQTHTRIGYTKTPFVVIPNGFDLSLFKPDMAARDSVRAELGLSETTQLIGLIARFDPQKNHTGFFEAARQLHKLRPDVHFLLAGRGIDKSNSQLMACMRSAGVEMVTHLLGERQDIPRLTASLDVASSSSSWGEAFPNVLGEAMACSVPCVATDVGDAGLIVGNTGRIVPRDDMSLLAKAWEELLALPDEELALLGKQARDRISEHFEIGVIVDRYATLYKVIAEGADR